MFQARSVRQKYDKSPCSIVIQLFLLYVQLLENQGIAGLYLPLLRQQVEVQAGYRPAQAAGQADGGGNARLLPPLPLGGLLP